MFRNMCLLMCLVLAFNCCVSIANATGLDMETEELSTEDRQLFLENLDFKPLSEDLGRSGITCFDVSENGTLAIGMDSGTRGKVYVFDSAGAYLWGYSFTPGQAYGVLFQGNNLVIYLCRFDMIVWFTPDGTLGDIQRVTNASQLHRELSAALDQTTKEINGTQYMLERDIPIGNAYSRFVIADGSGNRTMFYDETANHITNQISITVFSLGFLAFCGWGAFKQWQRKEQEEAVQ